MNDDEATCSALTDSSSCNANSVCSWCDAAAVRPACHSIENAKTLPPAVFHCSKVDEKIEKPAMIIDIEVKPTPILKDDEEMCNAKTSEDSCNALSDTCSWCKAGAVADACHSIENAKSLPPAVFYCSNLGMTPREMFFQHAEKMIE